MARYLPLRRALLAGAAALALASCRDRDATPITLAMAGESLPQEPLAASAKVDSSRRTALVDATRRLSPSVVSVTVNSHRRVQPRTPWDLFFLPEGTEQAVRSYGTGFVIRSDGVILTNQHVVADAEQIVVTMPDGTEAPGKLVGADPIADIAVIKIDRTGLPVAPLGQSRDLMIGEWVIAMGNPYAYLLGNTEPTVTVGVVSATGRNILPSGGETGLYLDMIQTDAAINPGNSGGPLANALGQVVGVNSSIFSRSGGSVGLGFAIPIERALRVAHELLANGTVRRAWTGLQVAGSGALRDWKTAGGVRVLRVAPEGPAADAGIKEGDVLTTANGRKLHNYLDWEAVQLDLTVGDSIEVSLRRGDQTLNRRLVTGDLPTVSAPKVSVLRGMQLITVTPAIQAERNLRSTNGALIFRITPDISSATGLQEGDVIVAVNRTPVRSADQLASILGDLQSRQAIRLYVEHQGQLTFTDLVFR
ncbi:MAG TPA: trypsin-like peptidase domain-containing protein [Gemmatimonadales bacterium]|nr:trypsin-like peptidase domain-containing protein [Gemmatimonadales bacterium]